MEEPGGLQSMGLQRVRHDWATSLTSLTQTTESRIKWPLLGLLPMERRIKESGFGRRSCRGRLRPRKLCPRLALQQDEKWWGSDALAWLRLREFYVPALCNLESWLLVPLLYVLVTQLCPMLCHFMDSSPQAPLWMELSRQEYWSGLPFPSPGYLPNPGIEPESVSLQADSLPSEHPGRPLKKRKSTLRSKTWSVLSFHTLAKNLFSIKSHSLY